MEILGDVGHVESHLGPFGYVIMCKIGAWFASNVP
jgi:hypothetical protein